MALSSHPQTNSSVSEALLVCQFDTTMTLQGPGIDAVGQTCLHIMDSGLLGPISILFQANWEPGNLLSPPQIQGPTAQGSQATLFSFTVIQRTHCADESH